MSIEQDSAIVAIDGSIVVIVIVAAGALVTRIGVYFKQYLDTHGSESLSKVILNLLLPSLLFTEMIKSLSLDKLEPFGMLFFFCTGKKKTAHTLVGCAVGWVAAKLSGAKGNMQRLMMGCIAFQDTTAIPLIFASVMGNSDVTDGNKDFKNDAIDFVLIYTVFVTVYKWTVAYK
jgi:predicted permease